MYVGRDFSELTMIPKTNWTDKELAYFHRCLQQVSPYLNAEGAKIHRAIIEEIEARGKFKHDASWEHGTETHYD